MTVSQQRVTAVAVALLLVPMQPALGSQSWRQRPSRRRPQLASGQRITNIATLAVIAVGASLFFLRFHFLTILAVCAGVWVMFNALTIIGYLQ